MSSQSLIAIVLPDLRLGGGQRVLLELARQFLAVGRRVDIVCLVGDGELRGELPTGAGYHPLVEEGRRSPARLAVSALPALVCYLRRASPAAILSSMTGTNLLTVLAHQLARCRGRLVLREAVSLNNTDSRLLRYLMRRLYSYAHSLVAVSTGVAEGLARLGISPDIIRIINNPVDVDRLRCLAREVQSPFAGQEPYLISVGRLVTQKDHATLLRAYARSELRPSHRLVLIGEGNERRALEILVRELGVQDRVNLLGALPNPYPLLSGAALLVLSSRWEGYPNVLLEALALDVPVVATDCPFGPRELLRDGGYGRLAQVGDAAGLARAMEEELRDPAKRRSEVLAMHHPGTIAAHYLALLGGNLKVGAL